MTNPEAGVRASHDLLLKVLRTNGNDYVPIFHVKRFWTAIVNPGQVKWHPVATMSRLVTTDTRPTESWRINDEDLIANEVKSTVKDLVAN